tara:strand:+ start:6157 stop:7791 length:1635 start_codon:yes stop_codon:yes gene_type:complete
VKTTIERKEIKISSAWTYLCGVRKILEQVTILAQTFACLFLLFLTFNSSSLSAQSAPEAINAVRIAEVEQPIQTLSASHDLANNDLLIVGHDGVVHYWEPISGLRTTPFLDLGVNGMNILDFGENPEQGLNGMTLDPGFDENGLVYVMYNGYRPDGTGEIIDERILCFATTENHSTVNTLVWSEVLELVQPDQGHNGGQILYGLDNFLYISTGDGGATGTGASGGGSNGDDHGPIGNAQNLESLLGKILRIETHGLDPYTIPQSNPFVGLPNVHEEIWAYGLRNPWRFCFDSENGDMFIGDVGEVDWEEIHYEAGESEGGLNYGWRLMEGPDCYEPIEDCDPDNEIEQPIFAFPHENGLCSVIGGVMYRGGNIPSLDGCYVLSDYCGFGDTQFFTLKENANGEWISQALVLEVEGGFEPWTETKSAFGEDNRGEIYLCTRFAVYKLLFDPLFPPEQNQGKEISISPNPSAPNALVQVNLKEGEEISRLRVFNSAGILMRDLYPTDTGDNTTFYTNDFPAGVYSINIEVLELDEFYFGKLVILGE